MMKNSGLLLLTALAALVVIALIVLTKLLGGALQFLLGALVVVGLLVLVLWMFAYAKRHR